jgi:DNA polymerase I-like protein with 3'-5' exonuclease and polymerase domains
MSTPTSSGAAEQISFAEVPLDPARELTCEDADCALRSTSVPPRARGAGMERLFHDLEMPLIPSSRAWSGAGIRIDAPFFKD